MSSELEQLLREHGARYHPLYQRDRLSDHLPMAALALRRLGATESATLAWCERYAARLEPADEAYLRRRNHFLQRLQQEGIDPVLGELLPGLISGWARGAYHPIIRLASGFDSKNLEEMAAGLAYFEHSGADARVAELAARAVTQSQRNPEELADELRALKLSPGSSTFGSKLREVIASAEFASAAFILEDNLRRVSTFALDAFASSHDFFALHLVTGAHAYRLLYPYAGEHRDAIFNLGIAAGFTAAGAPPITTSQSSATRSPIVPVQNSDLLALVSDDEHDIKIAYSALAQGRFFNDPGYPGAARAYLLRKREGTSD